MFIWKIPKAAYCTSFSELRLLRFILLFNLSLNSTLKSHRIFVENPFFCIHLNPYLLKIRKTSTMKIIWKGIYSRDLKVTSIWKFPPISSQTDSKEDISVPKKLIDPSL